PRYGQGIHRLAAWIYPAGQPPCPLTTSAGADAPAGPAFARPSGPAPCSRSCVYLTCYCRRADRAGRSPAGNDGGKQAGGTAGPDDKQAARSELGHLHILETLGNSLRNTAGTGHQILARRQQQPVQLFTQPLLGPARLDEYPRMLGRYHQHSVARHGQLGMIDGAQRQGKGARQGVGITGLLIDDALHPLSGEQGYCRTSSLDAPLLPQRQPITVLGFGEAEAVFAGIAQGGTIDLTGAAATDIANDQLQRPANGGIGAITLP